MPASATSELESQYAVLDARTSGLEVAVNKLDRESASGFQSIRDELGRMREEMSRSRQTPWGTLVGAGSLLVTVMSVIGILAYMPIKTEIGALSSAVDRASIQTDRRLERIWEITTPRTELDFRLKVYDQRFEDMLRQLGEVKQTLERRRRPVE